MGSVPRWYPVNVSQTFTQVGVDVVLTTDVPCHLWLFYTFKEPWVHPMASIQRGLNVPWHAYWCYVSWIVIEQEEAGDTLQHTFIITGLVTCNTIWYRFHGNVGGVPSPSDSAIFEKHYTKPVLPPPAVLAFSHCAVIGTKFINRFWYYGPRFTAQDSGTATKLIADIGLNVDPGLIIARFWLVKNEEGVVVNTLLWEESLNIDDIPADPNHIQKTWTIPDTVIVKDNWYRWGFSPTNRSGWNGYRLWYGARCDDPPDTYGVEFFPTWVINQETINWAFWHELKS
ncbi:hypothetical protein ES703_106764 [subsurface metagenome]